MSRIAIIGSGFVGNLTGRGFEDLGHDIIWYDIDHEKIENLRGCKNSRGSYERASADIMDVVPQSDACFICVPTPTINERQDLSCIIGATRAVGKALKEHSEPYLVVNRSTVLPGVTRGVVLSNLEETSGKKVGGDILLCHNPEFSTQINGSWTNGEEFRRRFSDGRVIIGEFDQRSGDMLEELYRPLGDGIFRFQLEGSEFLKYASNICLAARISYWNQMYEIAKHLGLNENEIARVVGMDPRIGKYGTVCGMAYGGTCLPKDTQALIGYCKERGIEPSEFLAAIDSMNRHMTEMYGVRE